MSEAEKIRSEAEAKVQSLQESCPHKKLSKWMDEWWAMAHSTGFQVKSCLRCGKVMKRRINCWKCGKLTEDYIERVKGDGKDWSFGEYRCRKCS